MGNRSFFNALHDREGDFLLATVLEGKVLSQEKRQTYVMFIQNGKTAYC